MDWADGHFDRDIAAWIGAGRCPPLQLRLAVPLYLAHALDLLRSVVTDETATNRDVETADVAFELGLCDGCADDDERAATGLGARLLA